MSTLLDVKNLGISFGGLRAVNDFDLKIQKEELYGLIGPNGAGKTTVFNLLTGVYKPDSGKVLLDGKDLTGKKNIEISKAGIARTFQNIRLFKELSVIDNARALATDPKLLLLDEPAAGMNPNETGELMDMIRFVRDEFHMTILLIEHDMKLVSGICEELTVLNFGEVLAQGKTTDVLNDPQVIKAYLGE